MPLDDRPIVVTGATGKQGGATARHLLAAGRPVRALVRNPESTSAIALREAGAEVVVADQLDRDALDAAFAGGYGVFSVQPASTAYGGEVDEVRMGINVADAADAAGIEHFVYASVGGVDLAGPDSPWQTKVRIERHLRTLALPTTIVRPVMFMENHADPRIGIRSEYSLLRLVPDGVTVQLIAADDIGAFAARVFADRATHVGQIYELAGDQLTKAELSAKIVAATGIAPDLTPSDGDLGGRVSDVAKLIVDGSFAGWHADIPRLRRIYPGLKTYDDWLDAGGRDAFGRLFADLPASR